MNRRKFTQALGLSAFTLWDGNETNVMGAQFGGRKKRPTAINYDPQMALTLALGISEAYRNDRYVTKVHSLR